MRLAVRAVRPVTAVGAVGGRGGWGWWRGRGLSARVVQCWVVSALLHPALLHPPTHTPPSPAPLCAPPSQTLACSCGGDDVSTQYVCNKQPDTNWVISLLPSNASADWAAGTAVATVIERAGTPDNVRERRGGREAWRRGGGAGGGEGRGQVEGGGVRRYVP